MAILRKSSLWRAMASMLLLSLVLTACAPATPAAPVIQTQVVEKIQTQVVVQTQVVNQIQTQVVEKTVVVEKQVAVTPTAGPAKKFAGQTLNMLAGQPHIVGCRNLAQWFEEETGAHVNCLAVPYPNLTEKATLDVTSGAGEYDIIQYWYPSLGTLVENGVLTDLTDWWNKNATAFKTDDIFPGFLTNYTQVQGDPKGTRWGIPYDGDLHLLFYNTTLFKKYNIANPPATWDEYLDICKKITEGAKAAGDTGVYGCGIMASKVPLILIGTFLARLAGFGGDFFDAQGNPTVNSPEAVAALEHLMKEVPYALPDPKAVGFDEMLGPWLTGRVGMVEFWTDLGQMTDNPAQSKILHEWLAAPMPKGPPPKGRVAAPMNAGWGLGMSTKTAQKDLVLAYLEFVMRPETNVKLNTVVGGIDPIRISTFDNPTFRAWVTPAEADAAKAADSGALVPWPNGPKWAELQDVLNENLAKVLAGEAQPKAALDDTQAKWLKILGK